MTKGTRGTKQQALTAMEAAWVAEFIISRNATEAAELAGYKFPNVDGPKIRRKAHIVVAIEKYEQEIRQRPIWTVEQKLRKIQEAAEAIALRARYTPPDVHALMHVIELHSKHTGDLKQTLNLEGDVGLTHLLTAVHKAVADRVRLQEAGSTTPAEGSA